MTQDTPHLSTDHRPLRRSHLLLLAGFCLALFGYSAFSGRPLSLHEARLPELSREMMRAGGDWLIPRSGGRAWLERPPLPHWVTVAVSAATGQHADRVWVVRLPAALAGTLVVLLTAWIAARWFGSAVGLCSGIVLATAYEFYAYACLAEDDIFLAALVAIAMALVVAVEFPATDSESCDGRGGWFGRRSIRVAAFFIVLGLTNLAKGPLVGAAVIVAVVGAFVVLTRDGTRVRRYLWIWGWLAFALLTVAWPWAVYRRYPEVGENWRFDYAGGTSQYDQPIWYYPVQLLAGLAPWTPAALLGLWLTRDAARRQKDSPQRFLWLWAILPILVLSIPHRKHHHYLVPSLAPWAILAAIGLRELGRLMQRRAPSHDHPYLATLLIGGAGATALLLLRHRIPGPQWATVALALAWIACVAACCMGLARRRPRLALGAVVAGICVACCWGQSCLPDQTTDDTLFLQRVDATVPRGDLLFINADLRGELDFFRIGFYSRPDARLLHNLTFLRDQRITEPTVYVITRAKDRPRLETLGETEVVLQSQKTRRETSPADRFTLFRLTYRPDVTRYPAPSAAAISPMEAMGRKKGPYCGPPF
jgi:4-amino-4-deoxy-L-arabinose transferase-like glycosyltransferase